MMIAAVVVVSKLAVAIDGAAKFAPPTPSSLVKFAVLLIRLF
jgi:hypothetical protein